MRFLTCAGVFLTIVVLCMCSNETSVDETTLANVEKVSPDSVENSVSVNTEMTNADRTVTKDSDNTEKRKLNYDDNKEKTEIESVTTEQTFEELEANMKKWMSDLIRRILPRLMQGASGSTLSGHCMSSLMRVIGGVRKLREWALRFVDATGKIPPGILEGTSLSLGDYDECLEIKVGKRDDPPKTPQDVVFGGKYCLLESHRPKALQKAIEEYQNGNKDGPITKSKTVLNLFVRYKHLTNNTFKLGVCVPSKCTKDDVQNILNSESLKAFGEMEVAYCETTEEKPKTTEHYIILGFFGFLGGCLLLGTCIDVYQRTTNLQNEKFLKSSPEKPGTLTLLVRSVSLYSNTLELLDVNVTKEPIRVLCAVRSIAVVLTIYSHAYGHIHELHFQKFSKPANFIKFFESFTFTGIANGSVGMDTIVFIAGITITYSRWRNVSKKSPVNLNVIGLLLQRYCRLSAAQLLVIGIFLIFPLLGSGPLWAAYTDNLMKNCRERWWLNILYVMNFWSARYTCLYHAWILGVIMQLTLVSVIVLCLLKWSPKGGILFTVLLILSGIIGVAVMTIINDLPGSMAFFMLDFRTAQITWRHVYTLPYDHVGPFCIGLLTGYFLAVKKDTLNISRKVSALIWCISTCSNTAVLFGLYQYRNGDQMGIPLATFYAIMHRNVWALGIAWLVVACTTNHGGVITKVLHTRIFIFFNRLCYMAFLLHLPIMYYHSGIIRERWFMGHFELMFYAIGYIGLSFIISFILYITCVKPFYFLESQLSTCVGSKDKISFGSSNKPPISPYSSQNPPLEHFTELNGCVNVGYSQKMDGL